MTVASLWFRLVVISFVVALVGAAVRLLIVRFDRSFNKCNKIRVIIDKFCCVLPCVILLFYVQITGAFLFLCGYTRAPCVTIMSHASLSLVRSITLIASPQLVWS